MRKPLPNISLTEVWEHYSGTVTGPDNSLWRKAKCVIHDDRSASASVNEDEGKWTCFTCDEHGDVFDLILRMEPSVTTFPEAIAHAERFSSGAQRPSERVSSALLPGRQKRNGSGFVPPWRRL